MGRALLWVCFTVGSMLCCGYASLWVVFFAMGNAGRCGYSMHCCEPVGKLWVMLLCWAPRNELPMYNSVLLYSPILTIKVSIFPPLIDNLFSILIKPKAL